MIKNAVVKVSRKLRDRRATVAAKMIAPDEFSARRRSVPPWLRQRETLLFGLGAVSGIAYFYLYGFAWTYSAVFDLSPEDLGFDRAGALSKAAFFGVLVVSIFTLAAVSLAGALGWMMLIYPDKIHNAKMALLKAPRVRAWIESIVVAIGLYLAMLAVHALSVLISGSPYQLNSDAWLIALISVVGLSAIAHRRHLYAAALALLITIVFSLQGVADAGENSAVAVLADCKTEARTSLALIGLFTDETIFSGTSIDDRLRSKSLRALGQSSGTFVATDGEKVYRISPQGVVAESVLPLGLQRAAVNYKC